MRQIFLIIINVLPLLMQGQYTYFNNGYPPPHPEVGSGTADNLIIKNNQSLTFGVFPGESEIITVHLFVDSMGQIANEFHYTLDANGIVSNEYADALVEFESGFLGGRAYWDSNVTKYYGRISTYNHMFQEQMHYDLLQYQADSVLYSDYSCARLLEDSSFLATGNLTIDTIADQNNWPTNDNILLTKISPDGSLVWHREFAFYNLGYFNLPQRFAKTNDLFQLPNGDLLVWGMWYDQADPFVIKFDSQGQFIDEVHWGHGTYSDWLPWPVQISEHEFMFAYTNAISLYQNFLVEANIKIGILDTDDMAIDWVGTYDYQHDAGGVVDFEKTPDGGYVVLGYGGDASIPQFVGEAFMLKIDADGNEEWYHTYQPPVTNYFSPQTYDLEVATDGSLLFLGNYEDADAGYYATWLVKTDACGDEIYSGCPLDTQERPNSASAATLLAYPNPAQNHVNIACNMPLQQVSIRTAMGQIVQTTALPNHTANCHIDTSHLDAGIYLLEAKSSNGQTLAIKLVKE